LTQAGHPETTTAGCVAGITVFRPDADLLRQLLVTLRQDDIAIFVHVDGADGDAIDASLRQELAATVGVTVFQSPENTGVGTGLNRLAEAAEAADFAEIVFFDQDSSPDPGLVAALCAAHAALRGRALLPAAVGPVPIGPSDGQRWKPPRYRRGKDRLAIVDFLLTSGSLVSLSALRAVGPFRADYVIDAIDTEWCFRARARGYGIYVARNLEMVHRIGQGVVRLGPLAFPLQSETRMRSYFRNQAHGLTLRHVPLHWKLRSLIYLPLQLLVFLSRAETKRESAGRLARALLDGVRGRLGPLT
jgi:rhamnosyltransferase